MVKENLERNVSFLGEACIISQINHENVVRTFESYISQRSVYIVMEYMSGGNLSELINKKEKRPLKDKIVINYTTQLASALRYIHKDHQIVHRDVSFLIK